LTLNQLRRINKHIKIKGITNKAFIKYARIVTGYDFIEMISYIENKTPIPEEGVLCVNSVDNIDLLAETCRLKNSFFGEVDIQVGYCSGRNSKLNYMEYHRSNKILVAVTDLIIFVGRVQDIKENQYDSNKAEAFFVPEGVAIEVFSTTLCSLPCRMEDSGFRAIIIQLKTTGTALKSQSGIDCLLYSKNRWVIAHSEAVQYINDDSQLGIVGENIEIRVNKEY
jgi:hypothetical protein